VRFEPERLIADCRRALTEADAPPAVREIVAAAVSDAAGIVAALGEPIAGLRPIHRSPELTIIDFAWPAWMSFKPHDHRMWAVIGIVAGREDNIFWRRIPGGIEAAGARSLGSGEVVTLGRETIHSVVNPLGRSTRAIHVYGGDFFDPGRPRSEWDPETLAERPWDMEDTRRRFAEAEARASRSSGG
jgi:predicted metal-dependent enzyme (double-stranded beta helix superfamily)